jgi:hypothetical protein
VAIVCDTNAKVGCSPFPEGGEKKKMHSNYSPVQKLLLTTIYALCILVEVSVDGQAALDSMRLKKRLSFGLHLDKE